VVTNGSSSRTYHLTVLRRPASPLISPNGGTFDSVKLATATAPGSDSIQVSTDSAVWSRYTAPIAVAWSKTIYARAWEAGTMSIPTVAGFKINIAHDTSLASLKVGSSITIPLVAGKANYTTDSVSVSYFQLLVAATPSSPNATITYNGKSSGLIDLIGPSTPVSIVVVNGGSKLTYSLTILQAQ